MIQGNNNNKLYGIGGAVLIGTVSAFSFKTMCYAFSSTILLLQMFGNQNKTKT
jgi:hypothetical protein